MLSEGCTCYASPPNRRRRKNARRRRASPTYQSVPGLRNAVKRIAAGTSGPADAGTPSERARSWMGEPLDDEEEEPIPNPLP